MPALTPELGRALGISAGSLNWITGAQLLAAAVSLPLLARLGDLYGHRRVLRVAGRILQAPLSALLPLEKGLVRDRLSPQRARRGIGLLVGALTFGTSAGMVLSGTLGQVIPSVHGVLLVPALATVLCAGVLFWLVPESTTRARGTVDWAGAALLSLGLAALLLGVSRCSAHGWSPLAAGELVLSAALLAAWPAVERAAAHPLVDIRITIRRDLLPTYAASFLLGVTLFGAQTAAALFLAAAPGQDGYGFGASALTVGWVLFPAGLCAFGAATVAPGLRRAAGARTVPALGGALLATGYATLVHAHHAIWLPVLLNAVLGFGTGLVFSSLPALILDVSPADRIGIATGVYSTAKTLGGSIGSAVAAVLSSMTIKNTTVPTQSAYTTVWWLCATASLGVTAAACALRRPRAAAEPRLSWRSQDGGGR